MVNVIKRLLDVSPLRKKKCKLVKEKIEYKETECRLIYNAEILLIDKQPIRIFGDVDICNPKILSKICFKNDLNSDELLVSKIDCKTGIAKLELIEIPPQIRGQGLATILFKSYLLLLNELSKKFDINITEIWGTVGDGNNFTPNVSKRMYKNFDGLSYSDSQKIHLNYAELKQNIIKYNIY